MVNNVYFTRVKGVIVRNRKLIRKLMKALEFSGDKDVVELISTDIPERFIPYSILIVDYEEKDIVLYYLVRRPGDKRDVSIVRRVVLGRYFDTPDSRAAVIEKIYQYQDAWEETFPFPMVFQRMLKIVESGDVPESLNKLVHQAVDELKKENNYDPKGPVVWRRYRPKHSVFRQE